ncbi:glycine cleavage system protein H [Companilactobacillus sp. DQM5]|uniref:glycine cleavage system protein H n=1 Tax=Companilactobacillus sp. DQM5 TaxID=3463359 RepID=UPI00405A31A4
MEEVSEYLNIIEDDNSIRIGLKKNSKDALGDVKFVDIMSSNGKLNKGDMFASIEAKKAVIELEAPFEGEIIDVNKEIEDNPEKIYDDDSWIVKLNKA